MSVDTQIAAAVEGYCCCIAGVVAALKCPAVGARPPVALLVVAAVADAGVALR